MAKRNRDITIKKIQKWIKEGRGQGEGSHYKPWLTIQDVPSEGLATRIKGWTSNRYHHLMSNLERDYFYLLDFSDSVTDIREQYPLLPLDDTLIIAEKLGVKHPTDPKTGEPIVMTTDFLISIKNLNIARCIKPEDGLENDRIIEKLEIERRFWKERSIDWAIVTENEIPENIVRNISWFHREYDNEDVFNLGYTLTGNLEQLMLKYLQSEEPINQAAALCDNSLGLEPGTALAFFRYMLARKYWLVDMTELISPHFPIKSLQIVSTMKRSLA
ncbi:TnsA endonuclease N-terminal domain-containing protein [Paenibacillus chondroitinus]|uniref:TnsA endonuclease N-terminal domain-containing protein n=1 Tax=Paenibacillus chondroitinus TaxID=59842 RepID=A0ABU6D4A3_9BACL|nr:TnsA endonuclease N-terminal domain-containing protein [Paenibacillus chondroitinus]MCY9661298.1 TnsA endonuclease N-terminal domain-containing protein [Paenibacillus anseongense]MEB4792552.1 TnsA endonuclease N-terminal domain-containing protein [Paenibacillus chondroitinus]